jgi:hypothetical protein
MIEANNDYLAQYQYKWLADEAESFWGMKVGRLPLIPLDPMNMSELTPRFVSALFKNTGDTIEQLLEEEQFIYIAGIEVAVNAQHVITINHGREGLAAAGFGRWLSDVTQVRVWDIGVTRLANSASNRFVWLLRGLMHGLTRRSQDAKLKEQYLPLLNYFEARPFGTEPAVMSLFSLLPTFDRIATLEQLDPRVCNPVRYYEKLSMAYVKHGRSDLGYQAVNQGWRLDLYSDDTFEQLRLKVERIDSMEHNSSFSYDETVNRLNGREGQDTRAHCEEFYQLLLNFSQEQAAAPPF